jgi:hypothetical protein
VGIVVVIPVDLGKNARDLAPSSIQEASRANGASFIGKAGSLLDREFFTDFIFLPR